MRHPAIDVSAAFDVLITFNEPVHGFDRHVVRVAYRNGPSVGLSSLEEVEADLVYRGRVDGLLDGRLIVQIESLISSGVSAQDDGQALSVIQPKQVEVDRQSEEVDVHTAFINLNVDAPPPPAPSDGPEVWSATMTVGESKGYEGYASARSNLLSADMASWTTRSSA